MKRVILFFFVLTVFSPLVLAETEIFKGKVITDTDKVIDDNIFRFRYDENSNKVFVQTPATSLIVDNGACKSGNVFRVCINSANFSYKNITTYQYYYELDVVVYKLTGSLTTNMTLTPSTLLQSETAEFKITITNPTDFEITNIAYSHDISQFFIKEVNGCTLNGNKITWQGSLQSKYDKVCTATIISEKEGTYNLIGNLSYFNDFETEKKTLSLAAKVLPKQLKVDYIIDQGIEVKKPFYINLSLQNLNSDEEIDLVTTLELPSNIVLLKDVPSFSKDFNILKLSSTLDPSSTIDYSLYLEASSSGTNPIKQKYDYTIKNIQDTIENDTFINVLEPIPIINFSAEYVEFTPTQKFIVLAKIKNPSEIYEITDIKARLYVPYNNEITQTLNKLLPNETYSIISNTLTIPENADILLQSGNKSIKLNLSIEYKLNDIVNSLNKSLEFKVKFNDTNTNVAQQTQSTDKSTKQVSAITEKLKLIKSNLLNKDALIIVAVILTTFVSILFIINRIRKRKRYDDNKSEKDAALKELQEKILK